MVKITRWDSPPTEQVIQQQPKDSFRKLGEQCEQRLKIAVLYLFDRDCVYEVKSQKSKK